VQGVPHALSIETPFSLRKAGFCFLWFGNLLLKANQEYAMKIRYILFGSLIFCIILTGCAGTEKKAASSGNLDYIKNIISENPGRINEKDKDGNSFLHLAVRAGNADIVKFLVSKGADVNIKDNYDQTPLQIAAHSDNAEVVIQLVSSGAEINIKNSLGKTPLHYAVYYEQLQIVKYLISQGAEINTKDIRSKTPLHDAVIDNLVEISKYLITKGAEVNAKDGDGKSSLHYTVINENLELIKSLVSSGANVNTRDKFNRIPLHYAADEGYLEIVKYLILKGSEIDTKAAFYLHLGSIELTLGCTSLHLAARNGHLEIVKYLVSQGADVNLKNNEDKNALDLAKKRENQEIVAFLESSEELAQLSKARKTVAKIPVKQAPPKESIKTKPRPYADIDFGSYSALIIGNNNYQYLPQLKTAQNDAKKVAETLKDKYGFKVKLLLDANRSDILLALNNLRWNLTNQDNLLVYYAGHGWLDKEADEGYWLPVNAQKENMLAWISNSSITASLRALKAKHVLIIADSCYSGKLARGVHIVNKAPGYLSRLSQKRARSVISSGGLEPVIDSGGRGQHSIFASAFLDTLRDNKGIMDGAQLFNKLRRPVMLNSDQTPEYSDIRRAGHEGGEFLFVPVNK
jgi:ankyrin repeat protein